MKTTTQIPVVKLRPFAGHPYKVLDNEEMKSLTESIREHGILTPLIVRPLEGSDKYEVISGHGDCTRRRSAGLETIPAFIHSIDRETRRQSSWWTATCTVSGFLPSEKAFAYKLKLEALNHRGSTCRTSWP